MSADRARTLARELVAKLLHLGRNLDVDLYSEEVAQVEAAIREAVLEEARWWARHQCSFSEDCSCVGRIAALSGPAARKDG